MLRRSSWVGDVANFASRSRSNADLSDFRVAVSVSLVATVVSCAAQTTGVVP